MNANRQWDEAEAENIFAKFIVMSRMSCSALQKHEYLITLSCILQKVLLFEQEINKHYTTISFERIRRLMQPYTGRIC